MNKRLGLTLCAHRLRPMAHLYQGRRYLRRPFYYRTSRAVATCLQAGYSGQQNTRAAEIGPKSN